MYYYLPLLYFGSLFLSYRYNKLQQPFFYSLPYMTTYGTIFYLLTELNYGMVYSYFMPLYYIWVMLQMNNISIHDSNHKQKLFLTCYEMLNYFKWDIKKETELDKDKQYMFSFHPHGYLSFGFQRMVLLEQLNKELGLTKKTIPLIHKMLFYVPFARELLQYFGSMECSLKNIEHVKVSYNDSSYTTRVLKLINFFDWVSYYASIMNKTNPYPVNTITKLKKLL